MAEHVEGAGVDLRGKLRSGGTGEPLLIHPPIYRLPVPLIPRALTSPTSSPSCGDLPRATDVVHLLELTHLVRLRRIIGAHLLVQPPSKTSPVAGVCHGISGPGFIRNYTRNR